PQRSRPMRRLPFLLAVLLVVPAFVPAQEKKPLPPEQAKAAFLKLLDRPKVPADVREDEKPVVKDGLYYLRWSFASETKADGTTERVPALTVGPVSQKEPTPVVIVLHGTGGSK